MNNVIEVVNNIIEVLNNIIEVHVIACYQGVKLQLMQAPMSVWRSCKMTHICRWQRPSWFFKLICRGPLCLLWLPAKIIWVQNLSVWRIFDCSALIGVKRNFEQTNPFECFFTLLGFTLIENRSKNCNSILPPICKFQSL